jgi:hypothetical protein
MITREQARWRESGYVWILMTFIAMLVCFWHTTLYGLITFWYVVPFLSFNLFMVFRCFSKEDELREGKDL